MATVGERIGPYALRERVLEGAETELWRAERDDGRQRGPGVVAVRLARSADAASDLRRKEYAALRAVEDKRFPRVVAYFAGQGALATTWVEGASVRELVDAAADGLIRFDPATAVDVALEVAQGVRAAHLAPDGPWVHGHINARQVVITDEGQVLVMGLGHSPEHGGDATLSPEQLAGRAPDARSDQWSIAALLYEMLTLVPLQQAREAQPGQTLGALATQLPAAARLLRTALATEVQLRYGSDGDFVRALHSLAREVGGSSDRERVVARLRDPHAVHPLPPALASLDAPSSPLLDAPPPPALAGRVRARAMPLVEARSEDFELFGGETEDDPSTAGSEPPLSIGLRVGPASQASLPAGGGSLPRSPASLPRSPASLARASGTLPQGADSLPPGAVPLPQGVGSLPSAPDSLPRGVGSLPRASGSLPRGVGSLPPPASSLPPEQRDPGRPRSIDLPVDPPAARLRAPEPGLRPAGPTLSPDSVDVAASSTTQLAGLRLSLVPSTEPTRVDTVDDEDTHGGGPPTSPALVPVEIDDGASVDLEVPGEEGDDDWFDEDKRPTVGDEPVTEGPPSLNQLAPARTPPMLDLPPNMNDDPLPDEIPTAGDEEPGRSGAPFNPAETTALVAVALFSVIAAYVALRTFA